MSRIVQKADYSRAFVQACREELAAHVFDRIHAKARNGVGGRNSGTSRQAARDKNKAELVARRHEARLALAAIEKELEVGGVKKTGSPPGTGAMAAVIKRQKFPAGKKSFPAGKVSRVRKAGAFDGGAHPRNDHGEFSSGGGGGAKASRPAKLTAKDHDKAADRHKQAAKDSHAKGDFAAAKNHTELAKHHEYESGKERARAEPAQKTRSGKLIHPDRRAGHVSYNHFDSEDHQDAARAHTHAKRMAHMGRDKGSEAFHADLAKSHSDMAHTMRMIGKAQNAPSGADPTLRDAQRLVSGMDFEMRNGAASVEEARRRASTGIRRSLTRYDNAFTPEQSLDRLDGLDLDIGSGNARARGYLGLDLYPYDFGTVIQDVGMGLGTGPDSVRSIRLVNTLAHLDDYRGKPLPLLFQIQSALQVGGRLYYEGEGALTDLVDWSKLPGLALVDQNDAQPKLMPDPQAPEPATNLVKQTFERVPVIVPTVHGADPQHLGTYQKDEALSLALAAVRTAPSAEVAMANLTLKSVTHTPGVRVLKLQKYRQLVTSVVYSPDELDTDGEYMTAEDIETAAHEYMRDYRKVGSEHEPNAIGAHVVESWITPTELELDGQNGPQKIAPGSWLMTVKVDDPKEWAKILNGQYTGFSLGGHASLHLDG